MRRDGEEIRGSTSSLVEPQERRGVKEIRGSNFVRRFNNYSSRGVNHFAESVCWARCRQALSFARTNWPPGTEGLHRPVAGSVNVFITDDGPAVGE